MTSIVQSPNQTISFFAPKRSSINQSTKFNGSMIISKLFGRKLKRRKLKGRKLKGKVKQEEIKKEDKEVEVQKYKLIDMFVIFHIMLLYL